ncbi:hypothetical protein D5018_00730 [Parashewanella curva]|uniref:Uncharacterized protein n=1 Tax=Parashewanella curva TaxID=2338552 RepID=A0A3L8Q249_9GAMM|nr:hypothetical protein [Parashewanella curva]RLV61675.1 hypothetical protein D5018_00730 [Parashewanella curva]
MSTFNKLKLLAFASLTLTCSTAMAASHATSNLQSSNNLSNFTVSTSKVPSSNFTPQGSIPSLVCKLKRNPATCIPVGNLSILPLVLKFPDTKLGATQLAQLGLVTLSNKTEKHDTEKVEIISMLGGKVLYNGDAKNYVGVKCVLNKCSDWD